MEGAAAELRGVRRLLKVFVDERRYTPGMATALDAADETLSRRVRLLDDASATAEEARRIAGMLHPVGLSEFVPRRLL